MQDEVALSVMIERMRFITLNVALLAVLAKYFQHPDNQTVAILMYLLGHLTSHRLPRKADKTSE